MVNSQNVNDEKTVEQTGDMTHWVLLTTLVGMFALTAGGVFGLVSRSTGVPLGVAGILTALVCLSHVNSGKDLSVRSFLADLFSYLLGLSTLGAFVAMPLTFFAPFQMALYAAVGSLSGIVVSLIALGFLDPMDEEEVEDA